MPLLPRVSFVILGKCLDISELTYRMASEISTSLGLLLGLNKMIYLKCLIKFLEYDGHKINDSYY